MKKVLVVISLALMSLNSFAISEKKLIDRCLETAEQKFELVAKDSGCTLNKETFKIVATDNRTLNPFKYLMWEMELVCADKNEIIEQRVVTQYVSYERKCY